MTPPEAPVTGEPGAPDVRRDVALRRAAGALASVGALAIGAAAVGALAVGAFAIGRLSVGPPRLRTLRIAELVIGRIARDDDR